MELQDRDKRIVEFIQNFHITNLNILTHLFFSNTNSYEACRKRLKKLHDAGYVGREREGFGREFVYFKENYKRSSLPDEENKIILGSFYSELASKTKGVIKYTNYTKILNTPFDQIVYFYYNRKYYIAFVNVSVNKRYPLDKITTLRETQKQEFGDYLRSYAKCDGYLFIEVTDKEVKREGAVGYLHAKVSGAGAHVQVDVSKILDALL